MTEANHPEPTRYGDTIIFPASLDPEAVHVVRRLCEAGLESYLVGGCVRDLLMGLIPKDFDISTEARPRQIRRLFRNSRIIGRRFKLAHIHFGDKVIEVATFRRSPDGSGNADRGSSQDEDLLITRDNEFGDAREDTLRRDFTINALLYDVRSGEVIDHVGGVHDLNARTLRTIGDPAIRLAEDPVRMLRAVKFAARLQLDFDPALQEAMAASAELILKSAPPRVLEEIFKLLTCGAAERALPLLQKYELLERLLPDIADCWRDWPAELKATGHALDLIDRGQRRVSNAFLLAALLLRPWHARVMAEPDEDPMQPAHDLLDPVARHMNIPRRDAAIAKHLLLGVLRLERPRRGRRSRGIDPHRDGGEPLALLYLGALTGVLDPELHARWIQRMLDEPAHGSAEDEHDGDGAFGANLPDGDALHEHEDSVSGDRPPRPRRRRRGGRRRGGRSRAEGRGPGDAPAGREFPAGETQDARADDGPHDAGPRGPGPGDDRGDSDEAGDMPHGQEPGADQGQPEPSRRRRGRRGGRGRRRRAQDGEQSFGSDERPMNAQGAEEWQGPLQEHPDGIGVSEDTDPASRNGVDRSTDEWQARDGQQRASGTRPADGDRQGQGRSRSRGGRRRRRGRSGGGSGNPAAGGAQPGPADAGNNGAREHHEDRGASRDPGSRGAPPDEGGPRTAGADPRTDQRGGQRTGQREGQRAAQRRDASPAAARGRRGGNRPRRDDDRPRPGGDSPRKEDTTTRGPGQRHPEDVEDFFDW